MLCIAGRTMRPDCGLHPSRRPLRGLLRMRVEQLWRSKIGSPTPPSRQHTVPRSRGMTCPRLDLGSLPKRGSRECRMHAAPAVSRAMGRRKRTRAYRFSGGTPAFPAQWLYGLYRALPGRAGLVVTVAGGMASANLTPASGHQDHTTSPYASAPFVKGASTSIASHPALVTIAKRPSYRDGTKSIYC
jgi:hypothetical protein